MSNRSRSASSLLSSLLGASLLLLAFATAPLRAQQLVGAAWQGEDLVLRLSDSAAYAVDVDESDTSHAVVRLWGVTPKEGGNAAIELAGPQGRTASITRNPPNELLVTLAGGGRFGCATLWHPYSRTLVVHTFRWEGLPYAQEQYYRALLAFEQNQPPLAISLLRGAHAAGETRATSALAAWYARRGENDLARLYLTKPASPDDYAALADVQRAGGDTTAATTSSARADSLKAQLPSTLAQAPKTPAEKANRSSSFLDSINEWLTPERLPIVLIVAGGALLLLVLIIAILRRASRRARREKSGAAAPSPATPVHGVRVVETQESTAPIEAPVAPPVPVETQPVPATGITEETVAPAPVERPASPAEDLSIVPESVESARIERSPEEEKLLAVSNAGEPVAEVAAPEAAEVAPEAIAEPAVSEPAIEEMAPEEPVVAAPHATEEPVVEVVPEMEDTSSTDPTEADDAPPSKATARSRQADELRRRIEMARSAPAVELTQPVIPDATIAEARKADLSRDAVALRRKLQGDGASGDSAR